MSPEDPIDVPCIRIREPGEPDVLEHATRALPPPGPGELRVRVVASGVNRADLLQRRGLYPAPEGFDDAYPGLEYAGTVEELGPACTLREVGDRVMGIVGGGGYAAALNVRERETVRVPDGLPLVDAGAIPEAYMTAWDALVGQAGLQAGETVLIHAVGSGVGTAALHLAAAAGARTIGTSRTPSKVERARAAGLDEGIVAEGEGQVEGESDGPGPTWVERVRDATGGAGVDVILDLVGASYLEGNAQVLGHRGRWIVVGVPGGTRGTIDLRALMAARGRIQGTLLRARPPEEKARLARDFEARVVPQFERGLLRPVVGQILPASRASEAHAIMEANRNWGKILLRWS